MNILALDTSSSACSIALLVNNTVKSQHQDAPMQQAQLILPMIDDLLKSEKIELNQLDAIAFGCGPGSFTGIRIATSIAQGLAYAMQIPLIPISSLAALAQAAFVDLGWKNLFVAIDARIQEVYCAKYKANSHGLVELIGQERVCSPSEIQCEVDSDEWSGVGNAWQIYVDKMTFHPQQTDFTQLPTAKAIIQLAIPRFEKQNWVNPRDALPVYLRDEVARKQKNR